MAGNEGMTRIDPGSPVYQEVARLYRIAQEMRPGGQDLWNGELYSRTDDKLGGLSPDKTLRLHQDLVLDHLTGGEPSHDPDRQAQALATVLHESLHARVEKDAPQEPNAVRALESIGLDEGLTEVATMEDYDAFVQQAGYDDAEKATPAYAGAVHATGELLDRATSSDAERTELLNKAVDQPVAMRFDTIADSIVRNELADSVPPDAEHQQAARAHLVNQMSVEEWAAVHKRDGLGPTTASLTNEGLDNGVAQIREHYQNTPDEPYPAQAPNAAAEVAADTGHQQEQQRTAPTPGRDQPVDLTKLPPPDATTRLPNHTTPGTTPQPIPAAPEPSSPQTIQPEAQPNPQPAAQATGQNGDPMRFLNNQAPAAHATRTTPSLGDGSRGAGAPAGPSISRTTPARTPTPDRGGRD
ncbi:hypothetical protein EV138_7407 [Kribbella voronezhensis]|uniref:Uncharacterized protein n=1 Tax=Kribbella voronezhensis TaxID=2512212 RepID=A0A4V3FII0_9ACTN|nr:hypothetical protein [Kribbella voronezhensis]TDU82513.1 hypothetical protein EV138_7407 [Kribbella voronezhensis]